MAGSFGSINTALTAIRYQQVALDVAGNNVSNATTEGYVRRRIVGESIGSSEVTARWSKSTGHGDGVKVADVQRLVDPLLDARVRREHGTLSSLQTSQTVLARVESGIGEPGDNGVAAAIDDFTQAWQDLANNPGGDAARQQVIGRATTLAQALHVQVRNVLGEEGDQRVHLQNAVSEVNTAASDLAALNQTIFTNQQNGVDVSSLLDRRDTLALRLAELSGAVTTVRADGMYDVALGGQALVQGKDAGTLVIQCGIAADGTADGSPLVLRMDGVTGSGAVTTSIGGEAGAVTGLLTTTLVQ